MLIACGVVVVASIAAFALSGGSDGGGIQSGGKSTSYAPSSGSPSGSFSGNSGSSSNPVSHSLGNPPKKANDHEEIKNEAVKASVLSLMDSIKNSQWINENNPGITIVNFDNGNAQCQSAATLQSLIGIKTSPLTDGNFHELIKVLNEKGNNSVSIKTFINDFADNNLKEESKNDNQRHAQYEMFISGKTVNKNSNGHGVATTTTAPKTASATDYMTGLMSLFNVTDDRFCIKYRKKNPEGVYSRVKMPALITMNFPEKNEFDKVQKLNDLINETFKLDKSFGRTEGIQQLDYIFLSTESMSPAEILYTMTNYMDNNTTKLFGEDYVIKSMVCRKTNKNLLTEGNKNNINNSGSTHFVCVKNDYKNKKFIKIDSSQPSQIKSCSNNSIINFIKDGGDYYNIPVIIIFEKEKIADTENVQNNNPVLHNSPKVLKNEEDINKNIDEEDWATIVAKVKDSQITRFNEEIDRVWQYKDAPRDSVYYNQAVSVKWRTIENFREAVDNYLKNSLPLLKLKGNVKKENLEKFATKKMSELMRSIGLH